MKLSFRKARILIVVIGILIFISLNFFQKEVRNFFYSISLPVQKGLWLAGGKASYFFETITEIKNLKRENEELKLKNQELLAENAKLKESKKENEILREALEIGLQEDFELILVNIIAKDPFEDSIIIDSGAKEGVLKDFPVLTQQKVLLGKVSEVYEGFSRISLVSNKEMSFSAKIQEPVPSELEGKETKGIIIGRGNLKLSFELALKEAEIEKDDILVTDILGAVFPEGLLVGQVKDVEKLDIEPFQRADVIPLFELKNIDKLFLIKKW